MSVIYRVEIQFNFREWLAFFNYIPTRKDVLKHLPKGPLQEFISNEPDWELKCSEWMASNGRCWISISKVNVLSTRSKRVVEFSA